MRKLEKFDIQSYILGELRDCLCKNLGNSISGDDFEFIYPPDLKHGDISSNFALKKARILNSKPMELAEKLKTIIEKSSIRNYFKSIKSAHPGFLNFMYSDRVLAEAIEIIENTDTDYGKQNVDDNRNVIFEFVSANPTGPLTIAHARQAAVGDSLCRLYKKIGCNVCAEYYLNDKGVQIRNLGKSVYARYLKICGVDIEFPEDGYKGDYIIEIAKKIYDEKGDLYAEKDQEEAVNFFSERAYHLIFQDIKNDLNEFRVTFDSFFSERKLEDEGLIEKSIEILRRKNLIYEKDGALWFKTTLFNDDKDRVLVKKDGTTTYLASDIPYHWDKLKRGYNLLVNIVGPDHHGYIPRLKAAVSSFGEDHRGKLKVIIVQLATLYRNGIQIRMSTRAGEFITLRELLKEIGIDAGRYFFVSRKPSSLLDFDLDLAKKKTPENPVFYVQYVHARISSIFRKYSECFRNREITSLKDINFMKLEDDDRALVRILLRFPDIVKSAALSFEPQRLTIYLESLAGMFHSYYNKNKIIDANDMLKMDLRLHIIKCIAIVVKNGLNILGVDAPQSM